MTDQVNLTVSSGASTPWTPAVSQRPQPVQEQPHQTVVEAQQANRAASEAALEPALKELSDHLKQNQTNLEFQFDRGSGMNLFKIVNANTGEVVRQVPSEDIIAMARKLRELANPKVAQGVLMDQES